MLSGSGSVSMFRLYSIYAYDLCIVNNVYILYLNVFYIFIHCTFVNVHIL